MFDVLNEKYQKAISDAEDEKLIMEAITGSDIDSVNTDPSVEQAAEEEVDIYSVPRKDLDKLDKFADKLVSSADYDDDDLDDLLDNDYDDDEIVVAEAAVETPSDDKVGSYNEGIQSGNVSYKMTDCEDRGGVGVNSVVARNNQLSEAVIADIDFMCESVELLIEDAEEAQKEENEEKKEGAMAKIGQTLKKAATFVLEKLRALGRLIVKAFVGAGKQLKKLMDAVVAKVDARELGMVRIDTSIYDNTAFKAINDAANHVYKIYEAFMNDREADSDYGISEKMESVEVGNKREAVPFNKANAMIYEFNNGTAKKYEKIIDKLGKVASAISGRCTREKDSAKLKKMQAAVKAINHAIAQLNKVTGIHQRNMNAAAEATRKYAKNTQKTAEAMAKGREKAEKAQDRADVKAANQAEKDKKAGNYGSDDSSYSKSADDKFAAKLEKKNAKKDKKAINASAETAGGIDESTGEYVFSFELNEAEAANAKTYEEFPENLKTDGTLDVEAPKTEDKPKDDLSDKDPKQPSLGNEVALAKATLAKAYTADKLASIPPSEMPKVRKAVTDMIATKSEAIASLKEAYEAHLADPYEVRAAILEDASAAKVELKNLQETDALLEAFMETLDERAEDIFKLDEDSEADLDDIDLDDADDEEDDKKEESKDEKKSDKKDKKSDDDEKDDKSDEDDDEDKDDDKKSEDKDSEKSKKSEKKDEKDDKECDDEDECEDESCSKEKKKVDENAALLEALGQLFAELD